MLEQNDTLDPISELCLKIYPDQIDVLQATTQIQLNGPDPLDYVNIYVNNDEKNNGLNSHFHYVSLGLSDLYGDERVHRQAESLEENSGYGYELTIRVKKEINENEPPKWPVKLLQALAKYTFQTGGILDEGDHVPNVLSDTGGKIRHALVCEDAQLKRCQTRFGMVKFLQIVGCTNDELKFAQQWSTRKILNLMKNFKELGHDYLLVDLKRSKSIFEIDLDLRRKTLKNLKKEGSFMSFVKSRCFWKLNLEGSSNDGNFKPYDQLTFNIDLETAKLFPLILKQRLDKENSFIFNGLDDRNLVLVPENFSNSNCFVTNENPIQSNGEECQILINKQLIENLCTFFQDLKLEKKEEIGEQICKKLFLENLNEFSLYLRIIPSEKILNFFENN
ncbi:suppressor of fused -like protein [Brachionus plicatilis]|uniref:Suppressor of fused-like protein n=1 Tax=Brachionus plicatilis TaxID=10195 RepID=A0A3M7QRT8_BRAPC|nr:suppressor of fused -like protein [Brachionus plicatilis]